MLRSRRIGAFKVEKTIRVSGFRRLSRVGVCKGCTDFS